MGYKLNENEAIGESVLISKKGEVSENVVSIWYKENGKYNYKNPGFEPKSEHFTQIVWKSTNKLGVSKVQK